MASEPDTIDEQSRVKKAIADNRWMMVVVLSISLPMILVWLFLAFLIVNGAISKESVLDNVEGLIAALAIITNPVYKIIDKLFDKWMSND